MPVLAAVPVLDLHRLAVLEQCSRLFTTNPFDPAWEDAVRAVVGPAYRFPTPGDRIDGPLGPNRIAVHQALSVACASFAWALMQGVPVAPELVQAYVRSALFGLWDISGEHLQEIIDDEAVEAPFYDLFVSTRELMFDRTGLSVPPPDRLLSLFYQARRAWFFAATRIRGRSPSAAAARAAIWRAVFGSDLCAYAFTPPERLDALPVLITGETGTGKELAAQAIGWSRPIPFHPVQRRFSHRPADDFHARNLCEVPSDLLPTSLFGHKKGAFTGAAADVAGFFSLPGPNGALFLDEIGEIPEHVQVQLLRPLQSREYVSVGESRPHRIHGKLIFATHRDLKARCREGNFREDLYERLNGVRVHMPPLRQVLAEAPGELSEYVRVFVVDTVGEGGEVEAWTRRVVRAIQATGARYTWPRNMRELKNYVGRYVVMGGEVEALEEDVRPPAAKAAAATAEEEERAAPSSRLFGPRAKAGEVRVADLIRAYVTRVYVLTGLNQSETARRTGLTRRRVLDMIDWELFNRLMKGKPPAAR